MQSQSLESASHVSTIEPIEIEQELQSGFAARLIRKKAKQLVGRAGFTATDRKDLEQEMRLRVWMRYPQFDPSKAHWNAFVTAIVERHVATLLERARRMKRSGGIATVSLSDLVVDSDEVPVELETTLGEQHKEALTGRYADTAQNLSDLRLDVEQVVAGLPNDLRELCELLKQYTITEAAEKLGIPRTSASYQLQRLRKVFADAGFADSFEDDSSDGGETR